MKKYNFLPSFICLAQRKRLLSPITYFPNGFSKILDNSDGLIMFRIRFDLKTSTSAYHLLLCLFDGKHIFQRLPAC